MKRFWLVILSIGFLTVSVAEARMQTDTFNSGEQLTSGKLFLNQVDTVSLYLSTPKIVYVPRLTKEMQLKMTLTLLGNSFSGNKKGWQNLVLRHIKTFNKTLMERLEYYTPELAKQFNPETDVEFEIKTGADRDTVATWSQGQWHWVKASGVVGAVVPVAAVATNTAEEPSLSQPQTEISSEEQPAPAKKRCPAMIGGYKTEEVAEVPAETTHAAESQPSIQPTVEAAPAPTPAATPVQQPVAKPVPSPAASKPASQPVSQPTQIQGKHVGVGE
ncbi:MAG: hypothetical protein Q7T11_02190 [Deltaproteobacteria bacterium]|nr:hypothetical protein [Deltaproteobacteria bacterium]